MVDFDKIDFEKIPNSPGVYIFFKGDEAIYIGKSKNLKDRIKAYFFEQDKRPYVPKIVSEATRIDWIVSRDEYQAEIMEENLIKKYKPKYNIRLKEGINQKYIKITHDEFPAAIYQRGKPKDGIIFGPFYISTKEIFNAIKVFGIRTCSNSKFKEFEKRGRPCIEGQIGLCYAPCVRKDIEYREIVNKTLDFLRGKFEETIKKLENEMWKYAEEEKFEVAAKIRDRIKTLKTIIEKHKTILDGEKDIDFLSWERANGKISLYLLKIRNGKLFGGESAIYEDGGQDIEDIARQFIKGVKDKGDELISDINIRNAREPKSEKEKEILSIAKMNALESIIKISKSKDIRILQKLSELLFLQKYPRKIEVFDFSNLGGKDMVGVKVCFEDGVYKKEEIRFYSIGNTFDDYMALENVLKRRIRGFKEGKEKELPDIIMIDGGKGHLERAKKVLEEEGVDIKITAISKTRENGKRNPRKIKIWLSSDLYVEPKGDILKFILNLRDTAHNKSKEFLKKRIRIK